MIEKQLNTSCLYSQARKSASVCKIVSILFSSKLIVLSFHRTFRQTR
nr:MAG TPA: hypothetical protein [Caudoviricetes sp.]